MFHVEHDVFIKGQVYWGVSSINNYNSWWLQLLVYKKLRIIQSYSQPFLKASTNSHRLRNSCARLLRGELHSNSPRLWNLYLALSKGLTAKKIELYGVFLFFRHTTVTKDIFIIVYVVKGKVKGGVEATFIPDL